MGFNEAIGALAKSMTAWGLDTKITVVCAAVSMIMAILQLAAAALSLRAAWRIADDQRGEAQRLRNAGHADFIEAISALARDAIYEADKAEIALRAGGGPNGILYNFSQRLADLHDALQPIRSTAPADAKLMLAVGRLARVGRRRRGRRRPADRHSVGRSASWIDRACSRRDLGERASLHSLVSARGEPDRGGDVKRVK
jgi:hypothetical protein